MAIGDQNDLVSRLNRVLPPWFGSVFPRLASIVAGIASALSWFYSLYGYAKLQTRIATASGAFLDLIGQDYLGGKWPRHTGQTDVSYRNTLNVLIFAPKNTRGAIIHVLTGLTGVAPVMQEAQMASDGMAYSRTGGYSSGQNYGTAMPFQVFINAYRPLPDTLWSWTTDADIYAAVEFVRPAAIKAWVRINEQSGQFQEAVTDQNIPGVTDTGENVVAGP